MSPIADRLAELGRLLDHLEGLRSRVSSEQDLTGDLSLRNDVLFSLVMVAQLVIDIASEIADSAGGRFTDYTEAVRSLRALPWMSPNVADVLERLPGFRNVVIHEYVGIDYAMVISALGELEPVREFARLVAREVLAE